jgi:threonine aldolase
MRIVDFRSDNNSRPTDEMRRAMAVAEVGNDGNGEDPTTNRLTARAAQVLGKEAGIFVCSGTMGNLVAGLAHCSRGDGMIVGDKSHMYRNENGGASVLGGIHSFIVRNDERGMMEPREIESVMREWDSVHRVTMVGVENTHTHCGGTVLTPDDMSMIADVARRHGAKVHVDGARIHNAAVKLKLPLAELAKDADSITFCLSKNLGAPIGAVLCGTREFIANCKLWRGMLGGKMRQVGVIAAAGIVALDTMVDRMTQDHANARRLARGLNRIAGVTVVGGFYSSIPIDPNDIPTNLVFFEVPPESATELTERLAENGIKGGSSALKWRWALYHEITEADVDRALRIIDATLRNRRAA